MTLFGNGEGRLLRRFLVLHDPLHADHARLGLGEHRDEPVQVGLQCQRVAQGQPHRAGVHLVPSI